MRLLQGLHVQTYQQSLRHHVLSAVTGRDAISANELCACLAKRRVQRAVMLFTLWQGL